MPLKLATAFSGIGAIEQALKRLNIEHNIVFACDNGDILIDVDTDKELSKIRKMNSILEKREYVLQLYKENSRKTNFVEIAYKRNYKIDNDNFIVYILLYIYQKGRQGRQPRQKCGKMDTNSPKISGFYPFNT